MRLDWTSVAVYLPAGSRETVSAQLSQQAWHRRAAERKRGTRFTFSHPGVSRRWVNSAFNTQFTGWSSALQVCLQWSGPSSARGWRTSRQLGCWQLLLHCLFSLGAQWQWDGRAPSGTPVRIFEADPTDLAGTESLTPPGNTDQWSPLPLWADECIVC